MVIARSSIYISYFNSQVQILMSLIALIVYSRVTKILHDIVVSRETSFSS